MRKTATILVLVLLFILTACGGTAAQDLSGASSGQNLYLTLVNPTHQLPEDWLDHIELVTDYDAWWDEVQVERVTLEHFHALRDRLLVEDGIDIELDSVYRSVADQEWLWNDFKAKYGEAYCEQYLAKPGYSEHHTGLAIDICLIKDGKVISDNDQMLAEKEIFAKIHQRLSEYGFILRYLPGKEDITGYSYEPWHLRYVGEVAAAEINLRCITLEEYLGSQ